VSRTRSLLDRWLDAYNAQDVATLCEIADPAIEIVPIEPALTASPGTVYRGHAGVRSLIEHSSGHFTQLHLEYTNVEEFGNILLVPLRIKLALNGDEPFYVHTAVVYETNGERLLRIETFPDIQAAHAAIARSAGRLSAREIEIVRLLAHGRTANQAADELVLSPHTVRTHIRNAKEKVGARTTAQLVAIAMRTGAVRD
jgi:DNA-binding CsgD family transcriptional regulator/ketosteroid isomerase-like protein